MRQRGCTVNALAEAAGISRVNMSHIKTGNIKAIRFSTLEHICDYLDCQPGDIIEFVRDEAPDWPEVPAPATARATNNDLGNEVWHNATSPLDVRRYGR